MTKLIEWILIFMFSFTLCIEIHSWIEPIQEGKTLLRVLSDLITTINIVFLIFWIKRA